MEGFHQIFSEFFGTVGVVDSIRVTLIMSFFSTLIASTLGIFLGLLLEKRQFPGKRAVIRVNRTLMGAPPVVIGLLAFVFDTIGGVLFAKIINLILKIMNKPLLNPMIGASGISAFPMSARVVQKLAMKEDPGNILIMQATGVNVSGQIASVIAGGLVISLVTSYL